MVVARVVAGNKCLEGSLEGSCNREPMGVPGGGLIEAGAQPVWVNSNFPLRGQFFRNFGWGYERYNDYRQLTASMAFTLHSYRA